MELIAVVIMVLAGGAIAAFVMIAFAIGRRENESVLRAAAPSQERDHLAASLLVHVVEAGGGSHQDAVRTVRRGSGIAAPVMTGIDVASWADRYARLATPEQRTSLLETAVQLVVSPVPLRQYAALLDLNFGLGFQTDRLAKLREVYGFDYIDHAKDARPRHADRASGGAPLFVRERRDRADLLQILGVSGTPTRHEVTAAYRKLVMLYHPDKFHTATEDARSTAAARFIEITRAYEELLLIYRD